MMPNAAWIWLVFSFAFVAACAMAPFLIWAFKTGQFKESDHIRSLALTCTRRKDPPEDDGDV